MWPEDDDYFDPDLIDDESLWPAWFGWFLFVAIFGGVITLGVVGVWVAVQS